MSQQAMSAVNTTSQNAVLTNYYVLAKTCSYSYPVPDTSILDNYPVPDTNMLDNYPVPNIYASQNKGQFGTVKIKKWKTYSQFTHLMNS